MLKAESVVVCCRKDKVEKIHAKENFCSLEIIKSRKVSFSQWILSQNKMDVSLMIIYYSYLVSTALRWRNFYFVSDNGITENDFLTFSPSLHVYNCSWNLRHYLIVQFVSNLNFTPEVYIWLSFVSSYLIPVFYSNSDRRRRSLWHSEG